MRATANPEAGRKLRALIIDQFDSWLEPGRGTSDAVLGEISTDFAELLNARLSGKPKHILRKEALDIQADVARFVESLGSDNVAEMKGVAR